MHAVRSLSRRQFGATGAGCIGVKFEDGLSFDHDPGDPRVGHREQEEEPYDGTGAEVQELDAQGESKEDAGGEDVNGPFKSHGHDTALQSRYLICLVSNFSDWFAHRLARE